MTGEELRVWDLSLGASVTWRISVKVGGLFIRKLEDLTQPVAYKRSFALVVFSDIFDASMIA